MKQFKYSEHFILENVQIDKDIKTLKMKLNKCNQKSNNYNNTRKTKYFL